MLSSLGLPVHVSCLSTVKEFGSAVFSVVPNDIDLLRAFLMFLLNGIENYHDSSAVQIMFSGRVLKSCCSEL